MIKEAKKYSKRWIADYRRQQLDQIQELRDQMVSALRIYKPKKILVVGEGVRWKATWIGSCIMRGELPKSLKLVTLLDHTYESNSFLHRADLLESSGFFIMPLIGDATDLPFPDKYFDLIAAPLMIDDCENHISLISELYRCTRKNGIVMVSGHGIDLTGELANVEGLIGSTHCNQITVSQFDRLLKKLKVKILTKWSNSHSWLRIFKK